MLVVNYYRADLAAPAKAGVLRHCDYAVLPIGCSLGQAHALAIEWSTHTKAREPASVYQIAEFKGPALSLTHYLPSKLED